MKITQFNKENLLIKGNNLIALHSLLPIYGGGVKLIYIDPPYNTRSDTFGYNDNFNHSTWLTFMKNRLEVAKGLLQVDGLIFISIDEHERDYLKVLCDQIFGRSNFVGDLVRKTRTAANQNKHNFNLQHEYCLIFAKNIDKVHFKGDKKDLSKYQNPDNDPNGDWIEDNPTVVDSRHQFIIKNPHTFKEDVPPPGRGWSFDEEKLKRLKALKKFVFKKSHKPNQRGFILKRYRKDIRWSYKTLNSLDFVANNYLNQVGTRQLRDLLGEAVFSFPKPVHFITKIIQATTANGDIVLDFFAGSGTTGQAVLEVNKKECGRRQFILIEQLEEHISVCKKRLTKVLELGNMKDSFICFELASFNQQFQEEILRCKNNQELRQLFKELSQKCCLDYNLSLQSFEDSINQDSFNRLSLRRQKELFLALFDNNQICVNLAEMTDERYTLKESDIKLTDCFYKRRALK